MLSGNHVGQKTNEWGSGSHFTLVQTDTDGNINRYRRGAQYIQEFGKKHHHWMPGWDSEYQEAREWTYNYEYDASNSGYGDTNDLYMMMGDFLGGSETFDGVTTLWGPN